MDINEKLRKLTPVVLELNPDFMNTVGSFLNTDRMKEYCDENHSNIECNCNEVIEFVETNLKGGE